jgi:hypothetical protein
MLALAACAAVSNSTFATVAGDAGAVPLANAAAGLPESTGDATLIDASACIPGDVPTFVPAEYHPAERTPGACPASAEALDALYEACFGSRASAHLCSVQLAPYPGCASCLEAPPDSGTYGPLIVDVSGWIQLNVAGCIELSDPSNPSALSCAEAVQELAGCEFASCAANCPVTPNDGISISAYDTCAQQADLSGCQLYVGAAACARADAGGLPADGGAAIAACLQSSLQSFFSAAVPLFCGPPPAGAGAFEADAGLTSADATASTGSSSSFDGGHDEADATAGSVSVSDAAAGSIDGSAHASDGGLDSIDGAPAPTDGSPRADTGAD